MGKGCGMTGTERRATLYSKGSLSVRLVERSDGGLTFEGHDLESDFHDGDEYEYWISVPPQQLGRLRTALRAPGDADLFNLLSVVGGDIVGSGEMRWLRTNGVEFEFASWH